MKTLLTMLLAASMLFAADDKPLAIRFGKLWDGEKVIDKALVVINNGRIISVSSGDSAAVPEGAIVLDWSKYYGLPGLIDVHTHMTYYWDGAPGTTPLKQNRNRTPSLTAFAGRDNSRKTLDAGVTTVRDLGASGYSDIYMRDVINKGTMIGPRMYVSGYGLQKPRKRADGTMPPRTTGGLADSPEEVVAAVQRQLDAGADVIKMYGSVGGFDNVNADQTFHYEEMKAAVDAAHKAGKKIAIHSYGPEGARDAVRAGADSLEHAVDIDDETLARMVKQGTYYVPTIDHNRYYIDAGAEYQFSEGYEKRLSAYIDRNFETAKRAWKAHVKFAMGSDAVFTMFGQNTRELGWFVKLGMTPEEALKTATTNAADLLDKAKDVGRVAPGFYGDVIAVDGDPLADIQVAIQKVRGVVKGGQVVK